MTSVRTEDFSLQSYDGIKSSNLKRSAWLSKSYCVNWYGACLINLTWYAILYKIMMLCYIEYLSIHYVWDFVFISFICRKGGYGHTHLYMEIFIDNDYNELFTGCPHFTILQNVTISGMFKWICRSKSMSFFCCGPY